MIPVLVLSSFPFSSTLSFLRYLFYSVYFVFFLSFSLIVSPCFRMEEPGVLEKVWQHTTINTTASSGYNGSGDYIEVLESKRSHVYSLLMAAIMGFLMVKTAIYDVNREFLQYQFG